MSRDDGRPCDVTQEYRDGWEATFGRKPKRPKDEREWARRVMSTDDEELRLAVGLRGEAAASCALDGETHCVDEKGMLVR